MSTSKRGAPPKGKPVRAYHHGNLRAELVTAGLRLLEGSGGAGFSLREAARGVGVTVNASYRHFANKDALLAAIAAEGFRRFAAALKKGAGAGEDPRTRMLGAGRAYVLFAQRHPELFRLMFGRFGAFARDEELAQAMREANAILRDGVASMLGKRVDAPEVDLAVLRAWSLAHGLSHLVMDGQLDPRAQGFAERVGAVLGSLEG